MSTRSQIGLLGADGSILAHYCHSDGYFSWNGRMLFTHYQDRKKIHQLIDLGDMSALGEVIGKKHAFDWMTSKDAPKDKDGNTDWDAIRADPRYKMCRFFKRDRNEKGDLGPERYESIEAFASSGAAEEFLYLYDERRQAWLGCATPYQAPGSSYAWHLLSDLAEVNWEDGRDDEGENPTVRIVPLIAPDDGTEVVVTPPAPLIAANDTEALEMDDPAARAIF